MRCRGDMQKARCGLPPVRMNSLLAHLGYLRLIPVLRKPDVAWLPEKENAPESMGAFSLCWKSLLVLYIHRFFFCLHQTCEFFEYKIHLSFGVEMRKGKPDGFALRGGLNGIQHV